MYGTGNHLVNHLPNCQMENDSTLHVVGVYSNPVRFHSRARLTREWYARMLKSPNVKVYMVEIAYGDNQFQVTEHCNPMHLQLRLPGHLECWHKENMINLGVKHLLPKNWKYMGWFDTDVFWPDNADGTPYNFALETIHQLQTYHVVQPWATCTFMSAAGHALNMFESFCYVHCKGEQKQTHPGQPYKYAHSGFGWACTRLFWENLPHRGLLEKCIVGSADHHQAWAMTNLASSSVHGSMPDAFKKYVYEWQDAAYSITHGALGFVKTHIIHKHHGPRARRGYRTRWSIFIDHKFDPYKDLRYNEQGLLYVVGKPAMQQEIYTYHRARNEDSIED